MNFWFAIHVTNIKQSIFRLLITIYKIYIKELEKWNLFLILNSLASLMIMVNQIPITEHTILLYLAAWVIFLTYDTVIGITKVKNHHIDQQHHDSRQNNHYTVLQC